MTESEFTHKTFLTVMVAVVDVVLAFSVFVVALFFGKLLFQMAKRVE